MFTTLRAKVFAGFLLILLLLMGLGFYAIVSFKSLAEVTTGGLEQAAQSGEYNFSMYQTLVRIEAAELRMLAADRKADSDLHTEPAKFYSALSDAKQAAGNADSMMELLIRIEGVWQDYQSHLATFSRLALRFPDEAHKLYERTLAHEADSLKALCTQFSDLNFTAFTRAKADAVERARDATFGIVIGTIIAVILGFVGSLIISRRTVLPLKRLTDSVKQLQAGHLKAHIPISGADEISDLGFEFNRLTERLQRFEAMNISEILREKQKSEAIIESIQDPLLLFDAEGELRLMNRAAEDVTGITEQTALGRPLSQLFRDKKLLKDIERALEQAATREAAKRARTMSATPEELAMNAPPTVMIARRGEQRYFRIRVGRIFTKPVPDPLVEGETLQESSLVGVLVFFTDITHFKELDRMKSDFIAKVSHEFRTPLTSMTMSLDILGEELLGKLNPEQHDIIDTSQEDARRLAKLIRDLLTLSRLESTKQRAEIEEEIQLSDVLEQLVRSLRPMYNEKGVKLAMHSNGHFLLRISREHLVSVVSNLLSNALKHTPRGGEVKLDVTFSVDDLKLVISVQDTGVGIAIPDQKRIFDKFVQVKHTDSSTPGSVGLGLAIVREIALLYDGRVDLKSAPGEGSTFTVTLFVAGHDTSEPAPTSDSTTFTNTATA